MIESRKDDWKKQPPFDFIIYVKGSDPSDRSLYNIMYEKKISYSRDEAYVQ